jgi:hypothetical protein
VEPQCITNLNQTVTEKQLSQNNLMVKPFGDIAIILHTLFSLDVRAD